MMKHLKAVFLLLLLFIIPVSVMAQGAWTHITEINGKEIGFVKDMASEDDGTIWIASYGGTFRYKDNNWSDESENLNNASVIKVEVVQNGDVWFNCYLDYLIKYDGENWYHDTTTFSGKSINDIDADSNGVLWCASSQGVFRYDGTNLVNYTTEDGLCQLHLERISVSPGGDVWCRYADPYWCEGGPGCGRYGVSHFNGDTWETYNTDDGLINNYVDDIEFGPDGSVYISCAYGRVNTPFGISRFNGSLLETFTNAASGELEFDRYGYLWAAYYGTLNKYDGSSWETFYQPAILNGTVGLRGPMGFDADGRVWLATNKGLLVFDISTGIAEENIIDPQEYIILTNYPNPFNASTTISFELPESSWINLCIYNNAGQKILTLVENFLPAGIHNEIFDGADLSSGLYFARLDAEGALRTTSMLLIK